MNELPDEPPDDPDDWTAEQWIEWLDATRPEPDDEPRRRVPRSWRSGGSTVGAAMLGLEQAIYGHVEKPEIVVVVDADGMDDGDDDITIDLPDDGLSAGLTEPD